MRSLVHPKILIPVVLLLIVSVAFLLLYLEYKKSQDELTLLRVGSQTEKVQVSDEDKKMLEKIEQVVELPDETPTIATVTDSQKLANQPFFTKSQNGDKLIVYASTKKAILYRPSVNKIIDIAPINIGTSSAEAR